MSHNIRNLRRLKADIKSTGRTIQGFEEDLETVRFEVLLMGLPTLPLAPTARQAQFQKTQLERLIADMEHIEIYIHQLKLRISNLAANFALWDSRLIPPGLRRNYLEKIHRDLGKRMFKLGVGVRYTMRVLHEAVRFYELECS